MSPLVKVQCQQKQLTMPNFTSAPYANVSTLILLHIKSHAATRTLGKIHWPCFMDFLVKNNLQPLPDDKFCCGIKAHYLSLLKATKSVNKYTQWDNGPETELNSMSVLLNWWSTDGNYAEYRGGKDQSSKTKEMHLIGCHKQDRVYWLKAKM